MKTSIISIDKDGNVCVLLDNLLLSNGLEWSVDEKRFYHTDSDTRIIKEYDFDKISGEDMKNVVKAYLDVYSPDDDKDTWFNKNYPNSKNDLISYFSARANKDTSDVFSYSLLTFSAMPRSCASDFPLISASTSPMAVANISCVSIFTIRFCRINKNGRSSTCRFFIFCSAFLLN